MVTHSKLLERLLESLFGGIGGFRGFREKHPYTENAFARLRQDLLRKYLPITGSMESGRSFLSRYAI